MQKPNSAASELRSEDRERVLVVAAPAGYGKKRFARERAATFSRSLVLRCVRGESALRVFARLRDGIDEQQASESWTIVLEDAEHLMGAALADVIHELLPRLQVGSLIVTTSRASPADFAAFAPTEVRVLRRSRLAVHLEDFPLFPAFAGLDASTQFRIAMFAHGWSYPMQILAEKIANEASPPYPADFGDEMWREVFDWLQAAVLAPLPDDLRSALLAAATFGDLTVRDFGDFDGKSSEMVTRLCHEYQLADDLRGSVQVLPLLRRLFHRRYAAEMRDIANGALGATSSLHDELRAIRGFIAGDQLAKAGAIAGERHLPDLADYAYPGLILESVEGSTPNFVSFPWLWLAVLPARRSFCTPEQLAAEGLAALENIESDARLNLGLRAATAGLLAESGRLEESRELLAEIPEDRWGDGARRYVELFIAVHEKRYDDALAWYRKGRAFFGESPAWFAHMQRIVLRAQEGRALVGGEDLLLDDMLASARSGHLPYAAGGAIAHAYYLAWLQGDIGDEAAYHAALMRLLYQGGSPMLWRAAAGSYGIDLDGSVKSEPIDAIFSLLFVAERSESQNDRCALIDRATALAEEKGLNRLAIASSIARAICDPENASQAIAKAARLAEGEGSEDLRHGLAMFARERWAERPRYMRTFADRFAPAKPEPRDETRLNFDIITGRTGSPEGAVIRTAEGTAALLALLASEGGSIRRERAIDLLWRDLDPAAGSNALKACLHRLRRQLGDGGAVTVRAGELFLGASIRANYAEILDLAERGDPARDTAAMASTLAVISEESWSWAPWEWFEERARRIRDAARAMGAKLIAAQSAAEDWDAVMATARAMVNIEPFDEFPHEALARAYLATGNAPLAAEEVRGYERLLKDELGVELSGNMRELLRADG